MAGTDLKTQMLLRLIDAGDWMARTALVAELSSSPPAIEDALADLVIEGKSEYRSGYGYRLAGGVQARRAAWLLRRRNAPRATVGEQIKGEYRLGVAEMQPIGPGGELSLVMFEMSIPMPADGPEQLDKHMRQIRAISDYSTRGIERG